jgi:ABC-2 type transport system permease protein
VELVLVVTIALTWFHIPFRGNPLLLLLASVLFLFTALGTGLLISTISNTQQEAFMSGFLVFLPSLLLSGFMFPVNSMPRVFQILTLAIPLRHYLEIVRAVFLKGAGFDALWRQLLALLAMGVALLWAAALRFRGESG